MTMETIVRTSDPVEAKRLTHATDMAIALWNLDQVLYEDPADFLTKDQIIEYYEEKIEKIKYALDIGIDIHEIIE
jgi:hypothetical protein